MKLLPNVVALSPVFRRKSLWLTLVAGVAIVAALGVTAMKSGDAKQVQDSSDGVAGPLEFAPSDISVVTQQPLSRSISVSGSLAPQTQALVKSTVSGEVRRVLVREGEFVRSGAVVVEIDTADARSRLDAAQADQAERRARLAIAERNRTTNQALLQQNFISQNAFDQLHSTYQGSEAAVQWSDAQVNLARKAMDDAVVRAPFSGYVAKRMVNSGERVGPETPLLSMVDLSHMELEATVPASDIPSIARGQVVSFHVDGFGARKFEGRVERINPVAEASSRAVKLFVAVRNADGSLRGGMFAEGAVTLSQSAAVPVIPLSASFEEAGQSYVFAVEDGKLAKRAVRLGRRDEASGLVEVAAGLSAGTSVVRIRMSGLKAGAAATLRAAPVMQAPTAPGA